MGLREYARHRGCVPSAVSKALATGRIKLEEDGKIDPVKADQAWLLNTNQGQGMARVAPAPRASFAPPIPGNEPLGKSAIPSYQDSRAIREAFNAKIARLDYEERTGKLLKAEEVAAQAFEVGRQVRDRILGVPSRLGAVLAAEVDANTIIRLLTQELRVALEGLSE